MPSSLSTLLSGALSVLLFISFHASHVTAVPTAKSLAVRQDPTSYWLSSIERQGTVAYGGTGDFKIYRNVKDYGATGDGSTDDTDAINNAISEGNRCGKGCDSSTVTPALVYFPPGTYVVSKPIVQYYYTQFVGDAVQPPTIKGAAGFEGMALIDANPYEPDGSNWYTNQNNFFRQMRNFVIDLTGMPMGVGAGIHWQVAQATSLQNIRFEMVKGGGEANKQIGIFMDNGSGGFMTDLTFNGGNYGAFLGSQQFTTRNLTFNDCSTAIFMNWNWGWTLKSVTINNADVGVDMSNSPKNQTVGSVMMLDSKMTNTRIGVKSAFTENSIPETGGSLVLQNIDCAGCQIAVSGAEEDSILAGGNTIAAWAQGRSYTGSTGTRVQGDITLPSTPATLVDANGAVFERSKPQYENVDVANFISVKSKGAIGDGIADDTKAVQDAMNSLTEGQILYFDHGAYVITDTVTVPKDIIITGEIWPLIMASGEKFGDEANPIPVFKVGNEGETGSVEMSDIIFQTKGNAPGAILMQWNLGATAQGSNGLWDVHFRVGGSAGTGLQSDTCKKNPATTHGPDPKCVGSFLMFHVTTSGSVYVENCWFWTADHELDLGDHAQIDLYNGRGVLIESTAGVWLYGTASEHNQLYNYQVANAKNVFMGFIQTETPYMQSNPDATVPFKANAKFNDPEYAECTDASCKKSWGFRSLASTDVFVWGGGLYSFFENYAQSCVSAQDCQTNMVSIDAASDVTLLGISTKAAVNMVTFDGTPQALDADNRSNFCATIAAWTKGATGGTTPASHSSPPAAGLRKQRKGRKHIPKTMTRN